MEKELKLGGCFLEGREDMGVDPVKQIAVCSWVSELLPFSGPPYSSCKTKGLDYTFCKSLLPEWHSSDYVQFCRSVGIWRALSTFADDHSADCRAPNTPKFQMSPSPWESNKHLERLTSLSKHHGIFFPQTFPPAAFHISGRRPLFWGSPFINLTSRRSLQPADEQAQLLCHHNTPQISAPPCQPLSSSHHHFSSGCANCSPRSHSCPLITWFSHSSQVELFILSTIKDLPKTSWNKTPCLAWGDFWLISNRLLPSCPLLNSAVAMLAALLNTGLISVAAPWCSPALPLRVLSCHIFSGSIPCPTQVWAQICLFFEGQSTHLHSFLASNSLISQPSSFSLKHFTLPGIIFLLAYLCAFCLSPLEC